MMTCNQKEYQKFVSHFPNLCMHGLTSTEHCRLFKLDFESSRQQLTSSYQDFLDCCRWLSKCRMDDYATHFSPTSDQVLQRINSCLGREVAHGVVVAAVLFLELPHVMHGSSPGLSIGISRFCSHYLRSSTMAKHFKTASVAG